MRRFAAQDLSGAVRDALGTPCQIAGVDRLRGESKKGVYRVRLDGSETASLIVYRWADEENLWPGAAEDDVTDPFTPASGLRLSGPRSTGWMFVATSIRPTRALRLAPPPGRRGVG